MSNAFKQPEVLIEEYEHRLTYAGSPEGFEAERKQVALARKRVKAQEDRLTDAYLNEAIEMDRYKAEMGKLQVRLQELERSAQEVGQRERQTQDAQKALASLDGFCRQVSAGLDATNFEERRQLLELVVERIIVEDTKIRVDTVISIDQDDGQLRARHADAVYTITPFRFTLEREFARSWAGQGHRSQWPCSTSLRSRASGLRACWNCFMPWRTLPLALPSAFSMDLVKPVTG